MKLKKKYILILSAALSFVMSAASAQNKDSLKADSISAIKVLLDDFNAIEVKGIINVRLLQGNDYSYSLYGKDMNKISELIEKKMIDASVKKGKLIISGSLPKNTVMEVTFRNINEVLCSGAGSVSSQGMVNADELKLKITGAGKISLVTQVNKLITDVGGAGEIILEGKAFLHDMKAGGASQINASKLENSRTVFKVSGACNAFLNVKDTLIGNVSGVSNIINAIEPAYKSIKASGISNYTTGKTDTTKIRFGKSHVMIFNQDSDSEVGDTVMDNNNDSISDRHKSKKQKIFWSGVGIGFNGFMYNGKNKMPDNYDFLELNEGASTTISINLFEKHLPVIKNHFNIVTGLGYEINNFRFKNNILLEAEKDKINAVYVKSDSINFSKNKLSVSWVQVPLLLQFDTKPLHKKSTLHFSAGLVGGIRVNSHTKQVYEEDGKKLKPKNHDDFNQPLLKYSAMIRAGYGKLDIYATYSLKSMFKPGEGPDIRPFSVGINIVGF